MVAARRRTRVRPQGLRARPHDALRTRRVRRPRGPQVLGGLLIAVLGAAPAAGGGSDLRSTMRELFAQIRIVLPLSLDDETFADPANRERITHALEEIRSRAGVLVEHGREKDAGFAFQSVSLAQHADTIARSYERGETRPARYLLQRSLDDCVACHSKLPTAHEFPMGQRLLDDVDLELRSARERARLQVVARQFDDALESYEALFAEPGAFASRHVSHDDLLAYLKICLTIENDAGRAVRTLARIAERGDLSPELARDAGIWIASIEKLRIDPLPGEPLVRARALLRAAEAAESEPASRAGLIYQIEAWHELQRLVAVDHEPSAELAAAYYLLGMVESRMLRPFGSAAAAPYLEAAIRTAPQETVSRDAFTLLEELTVLGYTGSGGTRVPSDVREKLDALERQLPPRE